MLGSRTGIRDITKATNDMRQTSRDVKMAWTRDPARKLELLIQERDARLKESESARDKAYGWGAKKFIQVAERAEHHARKAETAINQLLIENPGLEPTHTRTAAERIADATKADAEVKERYRRGEISKVEKAALLQQNDRELRQKRLDNPGTSEAPLKSHTVAIVLTILLGAFGVDRLYLGHNRMAVGKLVATFLTVGVLWWVIDAVLVIRRGTAGLQAVNWKQPTVQ